MNELISKEFVLQPTEQIVKYFPNFKSFNDGETNPNDQKQQWRSHQILGRAVTVELKMSVHHGAAAEAALRFCLHSFVS